MNGKWMSAVFWIFVVAGVAGAGEQPPPAPPTQPQPTFPQPFVPPAAPGAPGIVVANQALDAAAPDEVPNHIVRVLRTSNKAQINNYVPKVYDLKNVNPADVTRFIRRVAEIEQSAWYTFVGPDGKSGKVVFIVPVYQIPYIDKMMAEIDRPGLTTSSGTAENYYRLKHRSSEDAGFRAALLQYMATGGIAQNDPETNSIFLYDVPSAVDSALQALAILDTPTPQVRVDCTIYEADIQDDGTIGLDYMSWKNGPGRSAFAVGAFSERASLHLTATDVPAGGKGPSALFNTGVPTNTLPGSHFSNHGSNYAKLCDVPSAYFDYLGDKGKALIKCRATLTVLHSYPATFQTTDSILYYAVRDATAPSGKDLSVNANAIAAAPKGGFRSGVLIDPAPNSTGTNSALVAENRTVVGAVETRQALGGSQLTSTDTGVWVKVTPVIGTDGIRLAVDTSVVNHVGYADNGRPIVAKRASTAEVTVPDGKEIILSGMVHETEVHENRRVPILGSLPIIGYLFGNEIKMMNRRLVVVALKATRVNDFKGMTPEDENLVERAKGNLPIKMPGVRFEFRGDSFPR